MRPEFLFWVKSSEHLLRVPLIEISSVAGVAFFNLLLYYREYGTLRLCWERRFRFARELLTQAFPLFLNNLMMIIKLHGPTIMLGYLVTQKEVGWFGASYRIVMAIYIFAGLYLFNLLPTIARTLTGPHPGPGTFYSHTFYLRLLGRCF